MELVLGIELVSPQKGRTNHESARTADHASEILDTQIVFELIVLVTRNELNFASVAVGKTPAKHDLRSLQRRFMPHTNDSFDFTWERD